MNRVGTSAISEATDRILASAFASASMPLTLRMVHAIINGMTVKIDKAGRIVLPKPVRERFHLREGSELEIEEHSDGLTLRPVEHQPSMVRKNGIWVHLGKVPRDFDWDVAVDAIREERIKDTSGA